MREWPDVELKTIGNRKIGNRNPFQLPNRLWSFLLNRNEVDADTSWNQMKKKSTNRLINSLANDAYEADGKTTFKEEFVTCGGVSLDHRIVDHGDVSGGRPDAGRRDEGPPRDKEMERFRVEVGRKHGVSPGELVRALTDEAALSRADVGQIDIHQKHSTVDLPGGMTRELCDVFRKVQVCGQRLRLSSVQGEGKYGGKKGDRKGVHKGTHKGFKGRESKPKRKRPNTEKAPGRKRSETAAQAARPWPGGSEFGVCFSVV